LVTTSHRDDTLQSTPSVQPTQAGGASTVKPKPLTVESVGVGSFVGVGWLDGLAVVADPVADGGLVGPAVVGSAVRGGCSPRAPQATTAGTTAAATTTRTSRPRRG
jgi:hypothetical protein